VSTTSQNPLTWTLREIARLERGGLRPPRLTGADYERWHPVRRKLAWNPTLGLERMGAGGNGGPVQLSMPGLLRDVPPGVVVLADAGLARILDDVVASGDLQVRGRGKKKRIQLVPRGVSS
jgi:hypothetical protein